MLVAQEEVDSLLKNAEAALGEVSAAAESLGVAASMAAGLAPPMRECPPALARVLQVSVPVIVRLASRQLSISHIMQWGRGTIVEFGKPVDSPLELLVNDQVVGTGEAVKVGEKFGLRVTGIGTAEIRARLFGGLPQA